MPQGVQQLGEAGVAVVEEEDSAQLKRDWLDTAIARGRELVLLVGYEADIPDAILRRTYEHRESKCPYVTHGNDEPAS